jgi:hypothetical protein
VQSKEVRRIARSRAWKAGPVSPDGKTYVDLSGDAKLLQLVDTSTGKKHWSARNLPGCVGATFTPDGRTIVVWSGDRIIRLLDAATGTLQKQYSIADAKDGFAYTVVLSPDGRLLGYGNQRRTLIVQEAATGKLLHRLTDLPDPLGASAIAFAPDGKSLAWGGWADPTVHLIEVATGRERHRFAGQAGRVGALAFSADGTRLVSGNEDTTAVVWDLTGRLREQSTWGKPLAAADLRAAWAALASADAAGAYLAIQKLAGSPKDAVPFLRQRLAPVSPAEKGRVTRLIEDLDSKRFSKREWAAAELDKLGERALGPCQEALAGRPSAEVRRRLEAFKGKLADGWFSPSAEGLRIIRALEALERCGTAEARTALSALANGVRGAYLTEQAKAALVRLPRHP